MVTAIVHTRDRGLLSLIIFVVPFHVHSIVVEVVFLFRITCVESRYRHKSLIYIVTLLFPVQIYRNEYIEPPSS